MLSKNEIINEINKLINKYGKEEVTNKRVIIDLINLKNKINVVNSRK